MSRSDAARHTRQPATWEAAWLTDPARRRPRSAFSPVTCQRLNGVADRMPRTRPCLGARARLEDRGRVQRRRGEHRVGPQDGARDGGVARRRLSQAGLPRTFVPPRSSVLPGTRPCHPTNKDGWKVGSGPIRHIRVPDDAGAGRCFVGRHMGVPRPGVPRSQRRHEPRAATMPRATTKRSEIRAPARDVPNGNHTAVHR